uniref:Uncharacterized protein n=1 Tax=Naja naja TaxID=35670 RepID=A0A8C6V7K6_NAJNA
TVLDGRQVGSNCFFLDGLIGVTLDISRVGKDRDPSIKDAYKMQIGTENESADLNVLDTLQSWQNLLPQEISTRSPALMDYLLFNQGSRKSPLIA